MQLSDLIKHLQKVKKQSGNMPIATFKDGNLKELTGFLINEHKETYLDKGIKKETGNNTRYVELYFEKTV